MKKIAKKNNNIRIVVVSSSYRHEIADSLERHCLKTLARHGVGAAQVKIVRVPGALEIPLVAKRIARQKKADAIIAFGAIYKGTTYHFEQVANECVRGCMNVAYDYEIPVVFQVLSVYDPKDAIARATGTKDNRGVEAAETALKMIGLMKKL